MTESTDNKTFSEETNETKASFGPKLMDLNEYKAGMSGLNKEKVNKIIHETSKGSKFHSFQTKRQKRIDEQFTGFKNKLTQMTESQRIASVIEVNKLCQRVEQMRNLSRIIAHFDLDMFFAAVEIKLNPSLADKPIAVGSDRMIATSNYIARQYGVRAAMPGFVAKQLCPNLILIRHNFGNYSKESERVMEIISQFDPNFRSFSLDEVFIDLTDYVINLYSINEPNFDINSLNNCKELPQFLWDYAFEVVEQIRHKIESETQLTASAGISCNTLLAKVCTDERKPNGQFMVRGFLPEIQQFIAKTQVRKFCGIGPVAGQLLNALDINTGQDLWDKRHIIQYLFTPFTVESYMRIALGIGTFFLKSDDSRKSMSCERTFGEISDFNEICDKLHELSDRLDSDLKSENKTCKTVTLKLKRVSFDVSLKSQTIPYYTNDSETIYNVGKSLLETELSITSPNEAKYRLIGLKVSNLKDDNNDDVKETKGQLTLSQIFKALNTTGNTNTECNNNSNVNTSDYSSESNYESMDLIKNLNESDLYECSICSQTFDHKFLLECHENECIDEAFNISANDDFNENSSQQTRDESNSSIHLDLQKSNESSEPLSSKCPICSKNLVFKDNVDLNRHIDICLNKDTYLELTQVPSSSSCSSSAYSTPDNKSKKRVKSNTKANKNKSQKLIVKKESNDSKSSQKTIDFFFRSPK
jgi:DNA polymerase kappa